MFGILERHGFPNQVLKMLPKAVERYGLFMPDDVHFIHARPPQAQQKTKGVFKLDSGAAGEQGRIKLKYLQQPGCVFFVFNQRKTPEVDELVGIDTAVVQNVKFIQKRPVFVFKSEIFGHLFGSGAQIIIQTIVKAFGVGGKLNLFTEKFFKKVFVMHNCKI